MDILIAATGLNSPEFERLRESLAAHRLAFADPMSVTGPSGAEVVFGNPPADALAGFRNLRWLQLETAGAEAYHSLNSARRRQPVVVTRLQDFFGHSVSETALAGILAFHRQIPRLFEAQRERQWIRPDIEPFVGQLRGARVVILGAGSIGGTLATLLDAFGCTTRLYARRSHRATLRTLADLDAALPQTDMLVNSLPHSPATVGIIDGARLGRLPRGAVLVNVGRGSAVDEEAMLAALDSGRLSGAILDVTATEPLPPESPLWNRPNVILTQHTGGRFPDESRAKVEVFLSNLRRFIAGEPLAGVVTLAER